MISRRQFLTATGASVLAGGAAMAAPGWAVDPLWYRDRRVTISETFTPPEWLAALEAELSQGMHAADRESWRAFASASGPGVSPDADELHLLSLPAPGLEPFSVAQASQLAATLNDRLARLVHGSNGRIAGLASVLALDPRAANEAERAITRLGLSGLSLGANRGMRLGNRQLWPLYEFAQATHTAIYLPAAYSLRAGAAPYRALRREGTIAGAAADSSSHVAQLVFGGVLDAFPGLNFIVGRLGDATPHWYAKLAAAQAGTDTREPWAPRRAVSEYFRTNLFLTTAGMESAGTLEFCDLVLGNGRVLRSREDSLGQGVPRSLADITRVTPDRILRARRNA
jgi:predicted TIM-barrel fold metal-dependent hydrolase